MLVLLGVAGGNAEHVYVLELDHDLEVGLLPAGCPSSDRPVRRPVVAAAASTLKRPAWPYPDRALRRLPAVGEEQVEVAHASSRRISRAACGASLACEWATCGVRRLFSTPTASAGAMPTELLAKSR